MQNTKWNFDSLKDWLINNNYIVVKGESYFLTDNFPDKHKESIEIPSNELEELVNQALKTGQGDVSFKFGVNIAQGEDKDSPYTNHLSDYDCGIFNGIAHLKLETNSEIPKYESRIKGKATW